MKKAIFYLASTCCLQAALAGPFDFKPGGAEPPVSGSASAQGATNAAPSLEKCEKSFGTIAVVEPQSAMAQALMMYQLPPPTQLLRMMIQQSNCFQVVERGAAMQNMNMERTLSGSGQLQAGQNVGGRQMIAADFLLTPQVQFSQSNAGGAALMGIGSMLGPLGMIAGAVAGGIKNKQAQTSIIVSDARSGLQVAAAEGSVEKTDWGAGGVLGGAVGGAYSNTAEGKIVAAALLDNYNNVVRSIRGLPQLADSRINDASRNNAQTSAVANAFVAGQVLQPKINGIQLLSGPQDGSRSLARLGRDSELIYLGEERGEFVKVQAPDGEGWIKKVFLK